MAEQKVTVKLDPQQVASLKAFVREELAKQYGAGQAPEIVRADEPWQGLTPPADQLPDSADGWYETTTMVDLAQSKRTFISGRAGERQVAAARVELGKLRTRVKELADRIRDYDNGQGEGAYFADELMELLK
jgi:hypothetical protein